MSYLLYGLAGLAGGALAIYLRRRRAARRKAPPSTMACIEIILRKKAESPFVGSLEEAYFRIKPAEALALVRLTKVLDGDPSILDGVRQHHALPIHESQAAEGYFEQFTYQRLDEVGPPFRSPAPRTWRLDRELYDIPVTIEIIELFYELDVPIKDKQALVNWLQAAQTPEGRFDTETRYNRMFAERHPVDEVGKDIQYHHPLITGTRSYSEVEETAHAVRALKLLGSEPRDKAATIEWLQALQHPEGFISGKRYPDYWQIREDGLDPETMSAEKLAEYTFCSELDETYWAVMALEDLGKRPRDVDACRNWYRGHVAYTWASDKSKWIIVWRRVEALYMLGGRLPDEAKWIEKVRQGKKIGGIAAAIYSGRRFEVDNLEIRHIVSTMRSLHLLEVFGVLDEEYLAKVR